jgi:RNA polymerase sigma factor (sigma-70 family)
MLGAVVERLIKAMREVRPRTVRQFFALANQHMRWELNDVARRLDGQPPVFELHESRNAALPQASDPPDTSGLRRILEAIEALPDDEREAFNLVRIQGMTFEEAAEATNVSTRTVQRRMSRCLVLLSEQLCDLQPSPLTEPPTTGGQSG